MQARGPANELLYFTRVHPQGFQIPMSPARVPVDRVFSVIETLHSEYAGIGRSWYFMFSHYREIGSGDRLLQRLPKPGMGLDRRLLREQSSRGCPICRSVLRDARPFSRTREASSRSGPYMPTPPWPVYADSGLAGICRSRRGPYMPTPTLLPSNRRGPITPTLAWPLYGDC